MSGNQIKEKGVKLLVKVGMMQNESILQIDLRINPGCTEKLQSQLALVMLKNIEKLRDKGVKIKKALLVPELYSYKVPLVVLKQLQLKTISDTGVTLKRLTSSDTNKEPLNKRLSSDCKEGGNNRESVDLRTDGRTTACTPDPTRKRRP